MDGVGIRSATIVALCTAVSLSASVAAAVPSSAERCIKSKGIAATKYLVCRAKAENKLLLGQSADPAQCAPVFTAAFARADAVHACLHPGDATAVGQRVEDAEGDVLALLQAGLASTDEAKKCVVAKNIASANYAACNAIALARRIFTRPAFVNGSDASRFQPCPDNRLRAFFRAESRGGCLTELDQEAVGEAANAAAVNLADASLAGLILQLAQLSEGDLRGVDLSSADLNGATLRNADLSNADLTGARLAGSVLTGADLSGAILDGCTWNQTMCPDGTTQSGPGACCTHLNGAVPASCTP